MKHANLHSALSNALTRITGAKPGDAKVEAISRSVATYISIDTNLIPENSLEHILIAYFSGRLQSCEQLDFLLNSAIYLEEGVSSAA